MWHRYVRNARVRGIRFLITKPFLWRLYLRQNRRCALTGLPITTGRTIKEVMRGGATASIDRIDSERAYTRGNVQWVHKDVNKLKGSFSRRRLVELCRAVTEHAKKANRA